jgi:aspartate racemase
VKVKTIGILGGIGPQATMELEQRIHRVAQRRIPPHGNQGYPPLVTVFMRYAPVLVDEESRPIEPRQADPRLFEAARKLGEWADVIAIPSNTPHQFLDELREAAGSEVLDMIAITLAEVERRDERPVGVLGLGVTHVYLDPLRERGVPTCVPDAAEQDRLDRSIIRLMEGRDGDTEREAAADALASVRGRGAARTILGCSEIALLLGDAALDDDLVDPVQLLAEAAVEAAIEG